MNKQHFTETQIPDGAFLGILGGGGEGGRPVLQILTLFQTKKCYFSHPFSDLAFKKLCHHYLDYNSNNAIHSNSQISFSFLLIWD